MKVNLIMRRRKSLRLNKMMPQKNANRDGERENSGRSKESKRKKH